MSQNCGRNALARNAEEACKTFLDPGPVADPDGLLNLISSSILVHRYISGRVFMKIRSVGFLFIYEIARRQTDRQTDKQTNAGYNVTSLVQKKNNKR